MNRTFLAAALTLTLAATACGSDDDADDFDDASIDDEQTSEDDATSSDAPADATEADPSDTEPPSPAESATAPDDDLRPPAVITPGMTWNWQLQGDLDTTVDADVYDIDLFDVSAAQIAGLHDDGRIVVCYFSTAWEDWRADADDWPTDILGAPLDDWEGEKWVDIRSADVRSVLASRLDLAVTKGCDGVEPDNITAYRNDTGFDLTADDQLDFNRYLAAEAGERGLLIALKNNLEQIPDLVDHFDFAVNEQCVQYDECDVYEPFVDAGKAVFGAEYSDEAVADPAGTCAIAAASGVSALVLPLDLDGSFRTPCR